MFMYDTFLFLGRESVLNRPYVFHVNSVPLRVLTLHLSCRDARARRVHAQAMAAERTKPGITGVELV